MNKKSKSASVKKTSDFKGKNIKPVRKSAKNIPIKKSKPISYNPGISNIGDIQKKYYAMVEQASEALFIHDDNGKIVEVNKRACDELGYTREEILKLNVVDIEQDFNLEQARNEWKKIKPGVYFTINGHQKRKDGTIFPVEIRFGTFKMDNKKYFLGFVRDIADRKRIEDEIIRKEKYFRSTLDNMMEGCQILNFDWEYLFINDAAERHNKRPKEELIGKKYKDMWPGIEKTEVYSLIKDTLENRTVHKMENRFDFPDGSFGWFELSIQPVPEGVFILSADITERKKNEEAFNLSEKKYRYLFDSNPFPMWVYDLDTLNYLDVNESAVISYGYSKEEFLKMSLKDIRPKEDIKALMDDVALTRNSLNRAGIWRHRKKNGEIIFVEIVSHLIDFEGKPARLVLANNVTEKVQAERKLKESENHYRTLADSGHALIWTSGTDRKCDYFNKSWLDFTGRELEQELGDGWAEGVHPDDLQKCIKIYNSAFDRREKFSMEYRLRNFKNEYSWIIDDGNPRYNSEGEFIGYIGFCLDITERKQAEDKINEANERFRKIYEDGPYGIVMADKDFKFIAANKMVCDITGYSEDELKFFTFLDITYEEDKKKDIENVKKLISKEINVYKTEKRYVRKDGKIIWGKLTVTSNYSKDGEFMYNLGMIEDITEKKNSEEELKKISNRLNLAAASAQIGIWDWDIQNNILVWDELMYKLYGRKKEDFGGAYEAWLNALHPDDSRASLEYSQRALRGEIEYNTEFRIVWLDGNVKWIKADGVVFRDKDGNAVRMVGVNYDITTRKNYEENLKKLTDRLNLATSAAQIGIWEIDLNKYTIVWDEISCKIYGVNQDTINNSYSTWLNIMHPADRKGFLDYSEKILNKGGDINVEFRIIRKDGSIRWIKSKGEVVYDSKGKPLKMVGVNYDITDQKTSEESLRINEERLRQIVETSGVWVWEVDKEGLYTFVSKMEEGILGYETEELIGKKHFYDFFAPEVKEELKKAAFEVFGKKQTFRNFENPNLHKNGSLVYLETSGMPLLDENGNLVGYRGADRDITEKRKVENEIRKLNEELELRVDERTSQLLEANRDLEAFSYSVSHDLRAPLRAISGFSGLLLEDYNNILDKEGQEYLEDIMRNAKNMANLIDDLLQLSRYGRKQLEKTEINMNHLIKSVFEEEKKILKNNVILKISDLPDVIGDYTLIKQLVINLIANAIKFSSKNPNPEIEAGYTGSDKEITYYIKDNGVGFDMKYAEKLFGVFQRLHKGDEFSGTGVGLAIVSRIIAKHNGKICAESKPGEGATFYFTIPK